MLDIHLYDTYLVFSYAFIFKLIAVLLFSGWGLYLLTDKHLFSKKWVWLHVLISIFSLSALLIMLIAHNNMPEPPASGFDYSSWNHRLISGPYLKTAGFSLIVLVISQFIPVTNFIIGFSKNRHQKT